MRVLADTADCGMPGLTRGAAVLVALGPVMQGDALPGPGDFAHLDPGPYRPWLDPLLLAASGATEAARQALTNVPRPPHDHLQEALWCVLARAAAAVGHLPVLRRAREELAPAEAEHAGVEAAVWSLSARSPATWPPPTRRSGRTPAPAPGPKATPERGAWRRRWSRSGETARAPRPGRLVAAIHAARR